MNNRRTLTEWAAEAYWDFTDVNKNIERAEWIARGVPNGPQSGINAVAMFIGFVLSVVAAIHFDFASTFTGMEIFIKTILTTVTPYAARIGPQEGTPGAVWWVAAFTAIVTMIITIAPTVFELFASNFARGNVPVIKMFVLGSSIFDVVTDIPTTKQWVDLMIPALDASLGVFSPIGYYIAFFGWLLLATVGFQLSIIIFGYAFYLYLIKATVGMPISNYIPKPAAKTANQGGQASVKAQGQQQQRPVSAKPVQVKPAAEVTVVDVNEG